nr:hypothetical protein [Guinardia striata]
MSEVFHHLPLEKFDLLQKLSILNEKGMLLLLTPLFFCKTGLAISIRSLASLHLKGNLLLFLSKIKTIVYKTVAKMKLSTSDISKYVVFTVKKTNYKLLGVSTTAFALALYKYFDVYIKTPTRLISGPQYTGLDGLAGFYLEMFRSSGSQAIYDLSRTISTFSNAAIAGFLEPKADLVKPIARILQDNQDSIKGTTKQFLDSIKKNK